MEDQVRGRSVETVGVFKSKRREIERVKTDRPLSRDAAFSTKTRRTREEKR